MTPSLEEAILASSVNGGGVFLIEGGRADRLSKIDTTGMTSIPGGFLWARQAEGVAELRRLRDGDIQRVRLVERSLDLHDVLYDDGRLYVVSTEINAVFEFDAETFVERRSWYFEGEPDSQHINSICIHEGRILASRFGSFATHRGYKGCTRGAGEVFDVETGEIVIAGLSQPHSLTSFEGRLWLCDSEAHVVRCYRDFVPDGCHRFNGYVRGLVFGAAHVYVGLSRSRNEAQSELDCGVVAVVDRITMEQVATVRLPAKEVYDLRLVGDVDRAVLLRAALADANAEFDTLVHVRNLAEQRAQELALKILGTEHQRDAAVQQCAVVQEAASAAAVAAAHAAQEASDHQREQQSWVDILDAECFRLRAVVSAHEQVVHAQRATLDEATSVLEEIIEQQAQLTAQRAATIRLQHARLVQAIAALTALSGSLDRHRAFVEATTSSRSWRWTRALRRIDPEIPAPHSVPRGALTLMAGLDAPPSSGRPQDAIAGAADAVSDDAVERGARALLERLRASGDHGFIAADPAAGPTRALVPILGLAFVEHAEPVVSIVVTAYGNFAQTLDCLRAIRDAGDATAFEVILIEDASGDVEMGRFATVPGLRYHANPQNLGFLRSANQAAGLARGDFVHLLNNDTQVRPGWLDALLQTFSLFHECGMAGSTLVYPDGRLQEAGGIVWSDGNAMNVGRDDDASLPQYAVVREVDYVSGASLLLPTALLRELGGFDERYLPAYYEDTDLAFRLREAGYRVYVQPASVVVHHEGLSHGTDIAHGIKASQVRNREVFADRWRDTLAREQLLPGEHLFLARDRAQLRKIVLVVDRHPPKPDHDAGSRAIWQLMRVLFLQGFCIKFWADQPGDDATYARSLRVHGIEVLSATDDGAFVDWIAAHGAYLDGVVLSRPIVARDYIDAVRRHAGGATVFYGHDVHAQRIERQFELDGEPLLKTQAEYVRAIEQDLWRRSDLVLYPSVEETRHVREWLRDHALSVRAETVPLFAYEAVPALDAATSLAPAQRDELLFVGGFAHAPNADGALWFTREVWPLMRARHPQLRLSLVGAEPSDEVLALAADDVTVTGYLAEDALVAHYGRARVAIAPLRFGAGTKGKVLEALRFGVPCVTTPTGAQGLADAHMLGVADDALSMAARIGALVDDDAAWWRVSREGQEYVRSHFSVHTVWSVLSTALDPQRYADVQARRDALTARARAVPPLE